MKVEELSFSSVMYRVSLDSIYPSGPNAQQAYTSKYDESII